MTLLIVNLPFLASNNNLQINKFKEQTPGADFRVWKYSALK